MTLATPLCQDKLQFSANPTCAFGHEFANEDTFTVCRVMQTAVCGNTAVQQQKSIS